MLTSLLSLAQRSFHFPKSVSDFAGAEVGLDFASSLNAEITPSSPFLAAIALSSCCLASPSAAETAAQKKFSSASKADLRQSKPWSGSGGFRPFVQYLEQTSYWGHCWCYREYCCCCHALHGRTSRLKPCKMYGSETTQTAPNPDMPRTKIENTYQKSKNKVSTCFRAFCIASDKASPSSPC